MWIIIGSNGEYSDRAQWIVCWRASQDDCEPVLKVCRDQAKEIEETHRAAYAHGTDESEWHALEDRRDVLIRDAFDAGFRGNGCDVTAYRAVEVSEDPREFERFNAMTVGAA